MTLIEAARLALGELSKIAVAMPYPVGRNAITALRTAIEAAESVEPVATYTCGVCGVSMRMESAAAQRECVGLTDEDWKQLWAEFDSLPLESDFQDHMVSKYGAGHYPDADMYWQFQQQVIKQMVNAMLKEQNHG